MKAVCIHVALYGLTAAVVSGCDQPKPNCLTAQSPFVVKLDRTGDPVGDCMGFGTASFYDDPHVGFAPFYEQDEKGQPDYRKGSVAVRTGELANLVATAEEHGVTAAPGTVLHSFGKFSTEEPDDNNVCTAPKLSETRVVIPPVPPSPDDPATADEDESFAGQPAVDVTRRWSNVQVYVTPESFGTQTRADLEDVWRTPTGGTCTLRYKAYGLAPAASCQVLDENDEPVKNPDGTFRVDPTLCSPEADPSKMRYAGSGISPSANFVCDPVIGYCVLAGVDFPALK